MRKQAILILILALAVSASAQWVRTGLGGGAAHSVYAQGPFFLVRSSLGLFRSFDAGATWSFLPAPEGTFALAPAGSSLFAFPGTGGGGAGAGGGGGGGGGVSGGVWRSRDSGATWQRPAPGLPDSLAASFAGTRTLIAYGRYLLAGSERNLFRSSDQGTTWEAARVQDAEARLVSCLAAIGSELYACVYDGLLRSADSGATWSFAAGLGRDFPQIVDLAGDGKVLLAQGAETAYRSADTGATWSRLDALPEASFNSLLRDGSRFYATREDAVYRSADGGATWSRIGKVGNPVLRLYADGGTLYAATYSGGLSRSRDEGATWTGMGMPGARVRSLCGNGGNGGNGGTGGRIFAGLAEDLAIYRAADRGTEWSPSLPWEENLPTLGFPLSGVTALYGNGERMAARIHPSASGPGRLKRSSDGGATWITDTSPARFGGLFQAGSRLFADASFDALGNETGFFRSDDSGGAWTRVSDPLGAKALAGLGPWLIAATSDSILRSADGGGHWSRAGDGPDAPDGAEVLAVCGNDLFAASDAGLFRSSDSGRTWETLPGGPEGIRVLSAYGPVLFAGISARPGGTLGIAIGPDLGRDAKFAGVWRSADRGATWAPVDAGLDPADVTAMLAYGEDLYLGTDGDGVWRRPLSEMADGSIALRPRGPARSARSARADYRRGPLRFPGTDAALPPPGAPRFDANGKSLRRSAPGRAAQGVSVIPGGTIR
jgi:photosystem II stability/assembly factor-like uncharacterized protein